MRDLGSVGHLVAQARDRRPLAVARLVSLFEDPSAAARARQQAAHAALAAQVGARRGAVVGFTGPPGAGKSSLLARLTERLLEIDGAITLAVVAVDPTSPLTGGAVLGDRIRMGDRAASERLYFRSQASSSAVGGLAPSTFAVCDVLAALFDCVLVETVGVGQTEVDVRHLCDALFLVVPPLAGDDIQFLKAGITEVPDAFVVSKCDNPAAAATAADLRASLPATPGDSERPAPAVHLVSAVRGDGVEELARTLLDDVRSGPRAPAIDRHAHALVRWVTDEWGAMGRRHLDVALGGADAAVVAAGGLAGAQDAFVSSLAGRLPRATGGR